MTRTFLALLSFALALTAFGCGGSSEDEFRAHDATHDATHAAADTDASHEAPEADD